MIPQAAEPLEHGGDLCAARRLFPDAPEPFIDLSTGINPYPYKLPALPSALFERLPDAGALDRLATAAAAAYGAPSPACVVAAPGTQALLPLIAALVSAGRAAVLSPTYAEHARAAVRAGHCVTETPALSELRGASLAVVVNPNNPDGRVVAKADLLALAEGLIRFRGDQIGSTFSLPPCGGGLGRGPMITETQETHPPPGSLRDPTSPLEGEVTDMAPTQSPGSGVTGCEQDARLLVVDEAFMDVAPRDGSLAGEVMRGNIVVLRSFGKFFGLAGLRLGFAIAAPEIATRLRAALGPWAVSGPAIAVGEAALADAEWIAATRVKLAHAAERLDGLLAGARLDVLGGTALFRLVQAPNAAAVFEKLGRDGILVRRFAAQPTWLRFGLPGDEAAWERLARALASL